MSTIRFCPLSLVLIALNSASLLYAQQAPTAPGADADKLALRVYDVRDLVMAVPDHTLDDDKSASNPTNPASGGRFGGGGFAVPQSAAPASAPQPYHAVSPDSHGPQPI